MKQKLVRVGLLVGIVIIAITGCGGAPVAVAEDTATMDSASDMVDLPDEIEPETVADLTAQGKVTIIDVREDWEYAEGHISGATLIPLGSLPDRVDEIPTDQPVVLVCRSGNRSGQALQYLLGEGYDNVSNMIGGMNAWRAAGLDVEQ